MSLAWEQPELPTLSMAAGPRSPAAVRHAAVAPRLDDGAEGMEQIGEYLVRRMIGEGGMGRVYEAEERLSKRRVALKVMRDELAQHEQARKLFLNEMQILAHLEHANIVRSLASIETDGKLVMVLEYLEGRTLRSLLIESGRLPWDDAAHVVACVAGALVAAHGQVPPVIHRDLKPENIMVLSDGTVKVMDFGIAKLVAELNQTNTQQVGTLQYMSPEQIDAESIDPRADLYCLGLVFYELLAGHPPFQASSPRKLLNMQCTETPPELPAEVRTPKGVHQLVFQMLQKSPADRPAGAREVVERLEPFLPDRPPVLAARPRSDGSPKSPVAKTAPESAPGPAVEGARSGDTLVSGSDRKSGEQKKAARAEAKAKAEPRKDTVALVEAASSGHELSTGLALLLVLGLTAAAAIGTYFWRAAQEPVASPPAQSDD